MKTIVISMIGIGSILFVVMIQHTASKRMWSYERAETSLSSAMEQTMSEVMEENHYGIENRNEMLAALLQSLIAKWNHEIDLTVLVHKMDYDKRQMDVEVCGRMNMDEGKEETVSVRRKIVFEKDYSASSGSSVIFGLSSSFTVSIRFPSTLSTVYLANSSSAVSPSVGKCSNRLMTCPAIES